MHRQSPLCKAGRYLWYLGLRFHKLECGYRAASLVYATLLAMIPLAVVSFTVLSAIPYFNGIPGRIEAFIFRNFVTNAAQSIVALIERMINHAYSVSWFNLIFLFIICVLLIFNISNAFNDIWGRKRKRNYLLSFGIYLVVLIATPLLVGAGLLATTYLLSLPFLGEVHQLTHATELLVRFSPYFLTFLCFSMLYRILPTYSVRLGPAMVGGLISTLFFETAKWGFGLFLRYSTGYKELYGTIAALPLFLIWLYITWCIVLFGAIIVHEISLATAKKPR